MADSSRQIAPVRGVSPLAGGRRVLLVCSRGARRAALAAQLRRLNLTVELAGSLAEARAAAERCPDIVLCDWAVGDLAAPAFTAGCRARWGEERNAVILVMLPPGEGTKALAAIEAGANDVLVEPIAPHDLIARIGAALRLLKLAAKLEDSRRLLAETVERLQTVQAATDQDLDNARRLQQGLVGARHGHHGTMQTSLLLRPAGHIGGDLVGSFPINTRRVGVWSIDVAGHGVASALLTARLAAHLSGVGEQNIALHLDENDLYDARSPVEVAQLFNRLILDEISVETFFTLVYADIDVISGEGQLVQAGHPHPLIQRADGSVTPLGRGGLPIGLMPEANWDTVAFRLEPGDRLFITSDGITEAISPCGNLLGEEGLIAILRTNAFLRGEPLLESLCWSVGQFTQGKTTDDISAVLVERDPLP